MDGLCINGQIRYVRESKDFVELIDEFMGVDASKWISEYVSDSNLEIDNLKEQIESIGRTLEQVTDVTEELMEYCHI